MTDGPQTPDGAPKYVVEGLDRQDPDTLRAIARYADRLADEKEAELERQLEENTVEDPDEAPEEWDADEWDDALEDTDAPARATLTTKTIDGRQYYYYQWREGDTITSEYVAPVTPADR